MPVIRFLILRFVPNLLNLPVDYMLHCLIEVLVNLSDQEDILPHALVFSLSLLLQPHITTINQSHFIQRNLLLDLRHVLFIFINFISVP